MHIKIVCTYSSTTVVLLDTSKSSTRRRHDANKRAGNVRQLFLNLDSDSERERMPGLLGLGLDSLTIGVLSSV